MNSAERLLSLAKERGALLFGDFQLSSGAKSKYYFDGRLLTLDPEGAYLVAKCLIPAILESGAEAIAGPTLGADPIVASVAAVSHVEGLSIPGLIVRKEIKGYGGIRLIEGPLKKGMKVAVVDDTCTTGASLFHAVKEVEKEGCQVVKILSVMDRMAGGSDECIRRGYDFYSIFVADEAGNVKIARS